MAEYTGAEMAARARAAGAAPPLARIMGAASMAEGGGDSEAAGDYSPAVGDYTSFGPYQINDIHGLTREQRTDLDYATRWMLTHEFQRAYDAGQAAGYTGEWLARYTAMAAERPFGWRGPDHPGIDSLAADRYAAQWHELEDAMPEELTYDPTTPAVTQTDDWSCSVAATAWALQSLGRDADYRDLEQEELDRHLVSTRDGLRDATGEPLATWLAERWGLQTGYDAGVTWAWLRAHAGQHPILLGGRHWGAFGHWVGVRGLEGDALALANPAPGHGGIFHTLTEWEFANVGPCSAVWLEVEDMARVADLERQVADATNLLGNIQGDWVDSAASAIAEAQATEDPEQRAALLSAAQAALATIKRGGAPDVVGA